MSKTYRPKKCDFWSGVCGLAFFSIVVAMIALFVWAGSRLAETQKERETVEAFGAAEEWEEGEQIVFIEREN